MDPPLVFPDLEQGHGEGVASGFQFPAAADLESLLRGWPWREELLQAVFRGVVSRSVGEHQEASFMILSLPSMKKAVGGGEGGDVVGVSGAGGGRFGFGRKRRVHSQKAEQQNADEPKSSEIHDSHYAGREGKAGKNATGACRIGCGVRMATARAY